MKEKNNDFLDELLKKYSYTKGLGVKRRGMRFNIFSTSKNSEDRLYVLEHEFIGLKKKYKVIFTIDRIFQKKELNVYNDHPLRKDMQLISEIIIKDINEIFEIAEGSFKSLSRLRDIIEQ